MDWEVLIPILMFAFPVIVALLDKRAKQKRAASQPTPRPRPIFPSSSPAARELARNEGNSSDGAAGKVERSEVRTSGPAGPGTFENQKSERALRTQGVTGGGAPFIDSNSLGGLEQKDDAPKNEEGVRAIHRKEKETKVEKQPADKLKIDPKKLILYSEILKPKFDA